MQKRHTTKRQSRKNKASTRKILGLPIEPAEQTIGQIADELEKVVRANKRAVGPIAKGEPKTPKVKKEKPDRTYHGAPIPATKVYVRKMEEFKNCLAETWVLLNQNEGTTTFVNSYGVERMPRSSFNPAHYTWPTNEKKLATKIEKMEEVEDVTEWPTWIQNVAGAVKVKRSGVRECPKCGHSLEVVKFANEKKGKITCPDCGWRKGAETKEVAHV